MAFELLVESKNGFPEDLRERWEALLREQNVTLEICPGFTPSVWRGGFLPMKVLALPRDLIGVVLRPPALSGFEVSFRGGVASFRSASGRTSTEFALLCLCAALLSVITGGDYVDPQSGDVAPASSAGTVAQGTIADYLRGAPPSEFTQDRWEKWA